MPDQRTLSPKTKPTTSRLLTADGKRVSTEAGASITTEQK